MTDPFNLQKQPEENHSHAQSAESFGSYSPDAAPPEHKQKHAGLGIASFIIGITSILAFITSMVVAASSIMNQITEDGNPALDAAALVDSADGALLVLSGLLMIGCLALAFIGLVLGIIGVCLKNRRKVFGILGVVFNGLLVMGTISIIGLGLVLQ
ncbi:hypothetical protein FHS18_000345 [Paenibacillus phyllosphaerae]|uniref:DUF4064 domain-containing protein n=1 Tax=Paenibacillus phyllosphaerae TaxID=274593 RepID=A0A7W5ATH2_9BACL|nr:hypothetical protein [Paenibacillus phyllosphaerae]MBB3108317.1 hypothetical protein [Paenibacillus phyllosphaerae]